MRQIPPTPDNIRAALRHVSPSCERGTWVRILAAIKDALGEDGRAIADEWSQEGDSYKKADFRDAWKSIKGSGKVTVATLWRMAIDAGWKPDSEAREETEAERQARERQKAARAEKEAREKARKAKQAATKATALWKAARPAQADHGYLSRKGISPVPALREIGVAQATAILEYAPKSDGEPLAGRVLVVPVKIEGKLTTAELIDETGRKCAVAGGPKSGGLWAAQSLPKGDGGGLVLAVGEGVATVLTCREAGGYPVIASLTASNLPKVAKWLRDRYPAARLLILGDVGGGLKYAEQAARIKGAALAVPVFSPEQVAAHQGDHGKPPSDFNDLAALAGLDVVRAQLAAALGEAPQDQPPAMAGNAAAPSETAKPDGTGEPDGTPMDGGLSSTSAPIEGSEPGGMDTAEEPHQALTATENASPPEADGTGAIDGTATDGAASGEPAAPSADGEGAKSGAVIPFPGTTKQPPKEKDRPPSGGGGNDDDEPARPSYVVREEWSQYGPPGVWFHGYRSAGKGKDPEPLDLRVCSPLHVEAVTCTDDDRNFGRLLRFQDTFKRWRTWAMPMEMLRGSCEEVRGELLSAGVLIDYQERARLAEYLQWRIPKQRIVAAIRTGWTRDGAAFVLPEEVIGSADVYYQSESMHSEGAAERRGDFTAWKTEIAARCVGNPVLALSLCVALAGPLLAKVQRDSGGLHWVGDSSTGKTTALNVGCSVWGSDTFRRTWRATANGLEGAAAALNDTCLCLDEINEADPKEIGSIVYALGNGTGKTRANRIGSARQVFRWRLTLLSTGERTLAAQMAEGGKQPKAGQLVRLLNVPAARTHGAFDDLHGFANGRALSDHLKTLCGRHYGHAGPAFIEALLKDGRDFGAELAAVESLPAFKANDSQEGRGAARFALYGMAGELAQEWGILPWPTGEAIRAAGEGYRLWREARGGGCTEDRQILQAVADFIARHGDSRFSEKSSIEEDQKQPVVMHRAGWWLDLEDDKGRVYLFTGEALREAGKGHDFNRVWDALDKAGWVHARGNGAEKAKKTAIGKRKMGLYWILPGDLGE